MCACVDVFVWLGEELKCDYMAHVRWHRVFVA